MTDSALRVLVIDDSALVRQTMRLVLESDPRIAATFANDGVMALEKMRAGRFDVVLLDLEMPRMDGLTFLRQVMAEAPLPVVVCSALGGADAAMEALALGAIEVIEKPKVGIRGFLEDSRALILDAVRGAARARLGAGHAAPLPRPASEPDGTSRDGRDLVLLGASAGGTDALAQVLSALPRSGAPCLVVQHMPDGFTTAFARRLDERCAMRVKEARDGDAIEPGTVLVAPGNRHMSAVVRGGRRVVEVASGPLVSRHRPSVDVLFRSAARLEGARIVAALLTGMGDDGAEGLAELRAAGARTIAQDEASCVVFGMPRAAIVRGAAAEVLPLRRIAGALVDHMTSGARR